VFGNGFFYSVVSDMVTPPVFRLIIGLSVALELASEGVDYLWPDLSPEIASAIEKDQMFGLIESYPLISLAILLPWLVGAFAGVVGVFLFKLWGRALSLYSTVLSFFIAPFLGPVAYSGLSNALDEASITLWGVVLALAYFSPISERFKTENR